ncbi:MAG: hypothetical protein Q8O67_14150 [Deltaproteobacteria bacterium]|nr:hypothetical protein [Deltaproteobacteria bacterium]
MNIAFVVAVLAAQAPEAPAVAAPVAPVDVVDTAVPAPAAIVCPELPTVPQVDADDAFYRQAHAVLQAYAGQGRLERATTAVGAGALSVAMIGAGITYVAVGNADTQLSKLDAEDTKLAGYVVGGAAVIPAAVMIAQLVSTSEEEERLVAFEVPANTNEEKRARVAAAEASLQGSSPAWVPVVGGGALVVGGFASAGIGAYFLLLPHLPEPRGVVTHGTGAELIGAGVAALGLGIVMIATSGSTAPGQLELLQ